MPRCSPEPSGAWTVVSHPKSGSTRNRRRPDAVQPAAPRPAPSLRSPSAIAAEYRRIRSAWDAPSSPCCAALRALAARAAAAAAAAPARRAVCLGIGSFDPPDGGWEAKRRTYLQLIAFLVVVDELEKHAGEAIPCIFQEPVFTEADRDFIASLGHCVVDSPEACDRITPDTFLFGVHLYRPVYASALRNHLPALFVGTGWDVWDQVSLSEPPDDLLRLEEMDRTYGKAVFPQDPSSNAFSSTSLYWRTTTPHRHQAAVGQADEASRDAQQDIFAPENKAEKLTSFQSLAACNQRSMASHDGS